MIHKFFQLCHSTIMVNKDKLSLNLQRARKFMVMGLFEQAISSYKDALQYSAADATIYYGLGVAYEKLGYVNVAIDYLYQAGLLCLQLGDSFKAKRVADKMVAIDKDSRFTSKLMDQLTRPVMTFALN